MKKLSAIFLVFVLLLQMCIFNVGAQETGEITVGALEFINGTPSQQSATGGALIRENINLGYEVNLQKKSSLLELSYRTGIGERGIIEVRLGAADGPVIGTLDTTMTGSPEWISSSNKINLTEELSGTQYIYICGVSGSHWIEWFKIIPTSSGNTFAKFKDVDNFKDIANDSARHKINLLSDLGLILKDEKAFNPIHAMTRVDFVSILGRLLEAEKFAPKDSPFNDISTKDANFKVLAGLYKMGIIKGDTEGNFRPYSFIKPEEAATVCINALGYNIYAYNVNDILDIANKIDIFDGINFKNGVVTNSDGAKIIYNLLLADYLAVGEFGTETTTYIPTKNFVEKSAQYIHGKGRMTANSITGLYSKKKIDGIEIDEIRYTVNDDINTDFLGANCEFFYRMDGEERVLCAIRPLPKVEWNVVTSQSNITFEKITEREIIYSVSGEDEKKEYELSSSVAIIYNGTAIKQGLFSLISNPNDFEGEITFIDNDADGICECVWIDHLSRIVKVGGATNGFISDALTNSVINIQQTEFMLYIGTRFAEPKELFADDYLMIYESSDSGKNKLVRAIMKKQSITGQISQISSNGLVTIGDDNYKVSALCTEDLYAGYEGTFILDIYDRIIEAKKDEGAKALIGAFLSLDSIEEHELVPKAKIRLLTENGIAEFDVAEKVISDGVIVKNAQDFYDGIGVFVGMENVDLRTPVRYQLNSDNKIKMIDTVKPGTNDLNDTLTKMAESESLWCYNNVLVDETWLYKYPISDDVKVVALTSDGLEENFTITTGYKGFGDVRIALVPYTTNPGSVIADVLVAANHAQTVNRADPAFVFDSVVERVSSQDNEVVKCILGTSATGKVEYEVDIDSYSQNADLRNRIASLKSGDVVWTNMTNNRVTSIDIIYIPSGASTNTAGIPILLYDGNGSVVSSRGGGAAYLGEIDVIEKPFIQVDINGQLWTFNCSSTSVVICENNGSGKYILSSGNSIGNLIKGDKIIGVRKGDQAILNAIFVYRNNSTY